MEMIGLAIILFMLFFEDEIRDWIRSKTK